jgi:predicted ArsR family transcriptional regulator
MKQALTERQSLALAYIIRHPGCRVAAVAEYLGSNSQAIRGTLDGLMGRNLVEQQQTTGRGGYALTLWPTEYIHSLINTGISA